MAVIALLGSGEFLPWCRDLDNWCAENATAGTDRVLVIPTASAPEGESVFGRWASMGMQHYDAMGLKPEVVPLRTRADASDPEVVRMVEGARLAFFSGGNPGYLAETVGGTPFWAAMCAAVADGMAIGGCSAGAVFLGTTAPFVANEMLSHWVDGLRLLSDAYVMPHFDALESYMPGLRTMFFNGRPEGATAVGIDEDTGLFGDGASWEVCGTGSVWFADPGEPQESLVGFGHGETVRKPLGLRLP